MPPLGRPPLGLWLITEVPDPIVITVVPGLVTMLIWEPPPTRVSSLLVRLRMVSMLRESFLEGVFFMLVKRRMCDFFPEFFQAWFQRPSRDTARSVLRSRAAVAIPRRGLRPRSRGRRNAPRDSASSASATGLRR